MFFDLQLLTLRERGKFAKCWLAATLRHRNKLTRVDIVSTKIPQICDEIMNYLQSRSGNPQKRFSLYLATTLIYGTVVIYDKKVNIFQNDVFTYLNRALYCKKYGFNIIKKSIKKGKKRAPPTKEQEQIAALQDASNNILSKAGTVMEILEQINPADIATITMVEDPRPVVEPLPYEGGFGDEENFNILLRTMEEVISDSGRSPRMPHPTIEVVADIHPTPPANNLSTITDANPFTPHRKRSHSANNSELSPSKVRRTLFQDDLNAVVLLENTNEIDGRPPPTISLAETIAALPYTSTPVSPQQRTKYPEKAADNLNLQSLLDITPVAGPKIKLKKPKKSSFVDLQTIIPTADMPYSRNEVTTQTTKFKFANPRPVLTCNELFTRPARKVLFGEILNKFRFEVSARTHNFVDPSIAPDVNETPVIPETLGGSLSASSLEAIQDISAVPHVVAAEPLCPISEIAQSLPGERIHLEPQTLVLDQGSINDIAPPIQSLSDVCSTETDAAAVDLVTHTKSAIMKRDILENIKSHWRKGDREIIFSTLCPRATTNRILAAVTFSLLLELEAKKYISIIAIPNCTAIYKIRKAKY